MEAREFSSGLKAVEYPQGARRIRKAAKPPTAAQFFRHDDARTGAGMLSHARTRAHLRARGDNAPVSFAGQGIQAFFCAQKVDGSTHGHPVILVLETGAGDAEVTRTWEGPESTRRGRLKGM